MASVCADCNRLWADLADATRAHFKALGQHQIATIRQDSAARSHLQEVVHEADARRKKARTALDNHRAAHSSRDAATMEPVSEYSGNETILVVDDEPMARSLAITMLTRHGYTVMEASSGEEALRLLENSPGLRVDLLFSRHRHAADERRRAYRSNPSHTSRTASVVPFRPLR